MGLLFFFLPCGGQPMPMTLDHRTEALYRLQRRTEDFYIYYGTRSVRVLAQLDWPHGHMQALIDAAYCLDRTCPDPTD